MPSVATVAILLLLALPAGAGQEKDDATEDPVEQTVVIRSSRLGGEDAAGMVEHVAISSEEAASDDLPAVVGRTVGVQVRTLGGLGSYGVASIRGSTPEQVPVYLDGILLNAGGFAAVNLADFALEGIESLEVWRGAAPARLGWSGLAGAIVLHGRRPRGRRLEMQAGAGSWSSLRGMLSLAGRWRRSDFLVLGSLLSSRGDFLYLNRNGTLYYQADDRIMPRQNNASLAGNLLLKLHSRLGEDWNLEVGADSFARRQGIAGIDSLPTTFASLKTFRQSLQGRLSRAGEDWAAGLELSLLYLHEDFDDSHTPHGELGLGRQHTLASTWAATAAGWLEYQAGGQSGTARLEGRYENFSHHDQVSDREVPAQQRFTLAANYRHRWPSGKRFGLEPSARGELQYSHFPGGPLPGGLGEQQPQDSLRPYWQAAISAWYQPLPVLRLLLSAGRSSRPPSLAELFGDRGSVIGNPRLRAESAWRGDAGLRYDRRLPGNRLGLRLEGALFASRASDLITYVQNSQSSVRPENIAAADIMGVESSLRLELWQSLSLQANYTYLHAVNRSSVSYYRGKRLPGRPAHEAWARLEYRWRAPGHAWKLWLDVDYAGANYLDAANLKEDALARLLLGAGLSFRHRRSGLMLILEVRNLLDTITLADGSGRLRPLRDFEAFPLPGLTALVTLRYHVDWGEEP